LDKQKLLSKIALSACFFALCVIGLGAFTRLIDAGLGCPDWPGCYGHLTLPLSQSSEIMQNPGYVSYKAWAEMIHRYAVSGLSVFIISIILLTFSFKSLRIRKNIIASFLLIALLVYQIILGQLTVTLKLIPIIVTQHLLGGFLIISTLWFIYLMNRNQNTDITSLKNRTLLLTMSMIGLVIILTQIFLGAWTSTNYASLSCPDFPLCMNNQIQQFHFKEAFTFLSPIGVNYEGGVLSESARQTIQMVHRIGALCVTVYLIILMMVAFPRVQNNVSLLKPLYLLMGLLSIQLCLGMANVLFKLPLITAISHNLTAVLLLLCTLTLVYNLLLTSRKVSVS